MRRDENKEDGKEEEGEGEEMIGKKRKVERDDNNVE